MIKRIFCTALAGFLVGILATGQSYARLTGTQPSRSTPDVWCMGKSGAEVCVDYSGNLIPTTDSDTTLGTSSLYWATIYADDVTVSDDLVLTDDLTVNGDTTLGDAATDSVTVNAVMSVESSTMSVDEVYGLNIGTTTDATGTSILMLDGANYRVGINDTTPSSELSVGGTTPAITVGDGGEEDAQVNFDGNALDFSIGLDDTADSVVIGTGTTLGSGNSGAISINSSAQVTIPNQLTMGTVGLARVGTGSSFDLADGADDLGVEADLEVDDQLRVDGATDLNSTLAVDGDVTITGTTPTITVGDAGEEDAQINFDGNALDFAIGLDDSADAVVIGTGTTLGSGSSGAIQINSSAQVGIGAVPSNLLDIQGSASAITTRIKNNQSSGQGDVILDLQRAADGNSAYIAYSTGTTTVWQMGTGISANDLNFRLRQAADGNAVIVAEQSGAIANTLYLKAGDVGIQDSTPASELSIGGTTPTLTIGDAGEEDAQVNFDGNAQDYAIGVDDTSDSLVFAVGTALGTTTALTVNSSRVLTHGTNKIGHTANGQTLYQVIVSTSLADTQEYEISEMDGKAGWGHVIAVGHASSGEFSFSAAGAVTLADNTNLNTADNNDTTLNVFDSGTTISIENQLGGTYTLMAVIYYVN